MANLWANPNHQPSSPLDELASCNSSGRDITLKKVNADLEVSPLCDIAASFYCPTLHMFLRKEFQNTDHNCLFRLSSRGTTALFDPELSATACSFAVAP